MDENYNLKIFSEAVLTLNVDLDLSKVNSKTWHGDSTLVPNFMKIGFVVFEKSQ